jgi:small-conductance mechanosensitive channel
LRRALTLSDQGSRILVFWLCAALDVALILPGLGLILRVWGVPSSSIGLWTGNLLHGFEVGNIHFSLGDIALAAIVFVGFLTLTRILQRLLSDKLLPQTRLDQGVRHSLAAMVGYLGFVLAGAFAVSALGLNLANLAIIAGALSVGIGFGLQNIVNNFVSGLILLIERPIKVGDWVVVGQHQGYVTRISVRATEIETFERASVIVPNSELLSSAVVNWTHRDKYGRVDIKVGVAYGSDTAKVRDILLACARENRQILAWPQPYVLFRRFGNDGLEFELRGYVSDVEKSGLISSDLHFAVDKEFRGAGIEIPFAQRDLRVRNVGEIARAIAAATNGAPSAPRADQRDGVASAHPPGRRS